MFQTCNLWSQISLLKVEEGSQIDSKVFVLLLHHTFESNDGTWKEDYQKKPIPFAVVQTSSFYMALNPSLIGEIWIFAIWRDMIYLCGGFKYFIFTPILGELIQFHYYFSIGWLKPTNELSYETGGFWHFLKCPLGTQEPAIVTSQAKEAKWGTNGELGAIWWYCWWFRNHKQPPVGWC